jgi:hypothetical protein
MTMLMPTTHVPTKNILKIDSSPPGVNFDFDKSENDEYVTKSTDTFQEACLRLKIDPAHHKIYHDWLPKHVTDKIKYPFLKGHKNNIKMTAGMHLPTPHLSPTYQNKIQDFQAKNIIQTPFKLVDSSINTIIREQNIKSNFFISSDVRSIKFEDPEESPAVQLELIRKFNTANKIASFQPREHKIRPTIPYLFYVQASDKKLLHLAPINDRIMPPESVADAVDRKDIELILESWDSEMTSLGKFGAITHNHTRADLIKMGISTPPIPTRMLSDVKYKDGEFEKYKGRMIAQGFRMIKGVHFDGKTFSPTPNQHTNKILMALVAGEDLDILSFDISLAYTWGERDPENYPGGTKIALSYPPGLRRWNADGEQLYMVSHRSHYGLGPAGRTWFNTRQSKLLKMFNTKHWQSFVCTSEPCLMTMVHFPNGVPPDFKLRHIDLTPPTNPNDTKLPTTIIKTKTEIESLGGNLCHMITHVDDVDLVGKNKDSLKEIIKEVKKEWPIKEVSTEILLKSRVCLHHAVSSKRALRCGVLRPCHALRSWHGAPMAH